MDIATLLRKCNVLAVRLGNADFRQWVDNELNGDSEVAALPAYRVVVAESFGHFWGPYGSSYENVLIPPITMPEKAREILTHMHFMQPVSAYLAAGDGGMLRQNWPADLVAIAGQKIYQGMTCMAAWKQVPATHVAALLDTLRTRVLNFCLEIEAEAPDAGEAPPGQPLVPQERVSQVFNMVINGNVHNASSGGTNVAQSAAITQGASEDLLNKLIGVISAANAELQGQREMTEAAKRLKDAHGSPAFGENYVKFIAVLSDHIGVFGPLCAPYLPALTRLLT